MYSEYLQLLQLLQLADSAIPIGNAAHSFGLETLASVDHLTSDQLFIFFHDYIQESGLLECVYIRHAYRLNSLQRTDFEDVWHSLNMRLSALKGARESRNASTTLGRRFLQLVQLLVQGTDGSAPVAHALCLVKSAGVEAHYCTAFGLAGGILEIDATTLVLAYLQQTLTSLIYACQRLLPVGQNQASSLIWRLKPILVDIGEQSANIPLEEAASFTPLLDLGSMRHPALTTRLFIS